MRFFDIYFLLVLLSAYLFGGFVPFEMQRYMYSISVMIKSFFMLIFPIFVSVLIFSLTLSIYSTLTKFVFVTLLCLVMSDIVSCVLAGVVGSVVFSDVDVSIVSHVDPKNSIEPFDVFLFPKLIDGGVGLLLGLVLGVLVSALTVQEKRDRLLEYVQKFIGYTIKFFRLIVPLFVVGLVLKLRHDSPLRVIASNYPIVLITFLVSCFSYIILVYYALSGAKLKIFCKFIKNMFPAVAAAFTSVSSAAAMPMTISGVMANSKNKALSPYVVSSTVNYHLIGDCFLVPIMIFAILKSQCLPFPGFSDYALFLVFFTLAKFSVVPVPGGGIIVVIPILVNQMHFSTDMVSAITALYVLFDPFSTTANVLGNGALAILVDKLLAVTKTKINIRSST